VIIDPKTGTIIRDYENQEEGEGSEIHFSPDGDQLIDGSWNGVLTIRRRKDGAILRRQQVPGESISRVSHDLARSLWLVEHSPKVRQGENVPRPAYVSVHRWPLAEDNAQTFCFGMHIESAQLSPDGTRFCFIQKWDERRMHIARVSDGQIIASSPPIEGGGTGSELAWSIDGRYIGAVCRGAFVFLRTSDLAVIGRMAVQYPSSVSFIPGGEDVVLGSWKTSVIVKCEVVMDQ
jgi:hypothetical protein